MNKNEINNIAAARVNEMIPVFDFETGEVVFYLNCEGKDLGKPVSSITILYEELGIIQHSIMFDGNEAFHAPIRFQSDQKCYADRLRTQDLLTYFLYTKCDDLQFIVRDYGIAKNCIKEVLRGVDARTM